MDIPSLDQIACGIRRHTKLLRKRQPAQSLIQTCDLSTVSSLCRLKGFINLANLARHNTRPIIRRADNRGQLLFSTQCLNSL